MTLQEFKDSVTAPEPPQLQSPLLDAMWHERKGDWEKAHNIAQDIPTPEASWVHAYLHRREGDIGNAGYWYRRAGRPPVSKDLDREWEEIAGWLLSHQTE